jgi:hypothetical protein
LKDLPDEDLLGLVLVVRGLGSGARPGFHMAEHVIEESLSRDSAL